MTLDKRVLALQLKVAECRECAGVGSDLNSGHLPRGLWLDREQPSVGKPVLIIGQNPGRPMKKERSLYGADVQGDRRKCVALLNELVSEDILGRAYYSNMRELARALGFRGQIVWSDLAKCSAPDNGQLPIHPNVEIYSRCTSRWLQRELALLRDWPIIAAGRATFDVLWPMLPKRSVVGVPHPTGSYGHFHRLMNEGLTVARSNLRGSTRRGVLHVYLSG